ncbi:Os01g0273250 [Oryza sativa Japonica Group]|uniref:Os01g0273250 protein n=1 Tax=Oryza sativa subsp. japonica TaxID=39947 RepID=A0A0N7KCR1_ORYSJ|nr:Os01g0273250 [Oryza sativa Japonica Group]
MARGAVAAGEMRSGRRCSSPASLFASPSCAAPIAGEFDELSPSPASSSTASTHRPHPQRVLPPHLNASPPSPESSSTPPPSPMSSSPC